MTTKKTSGAKTRTKTRAKKKTGKKAKSSKSNKPMEFIVAQLKRNPKIAYADLQERAAKKGLKIYPIMFGRAQALLGLVKVAARGSSKRHKKTTGRRPGRPRTVGTRRSKATITTPLGAIQDLVSNLEDHVRENGELRETLDKIRNLCNTVL